MSYRDHLHPQQFAKVSPSQLSQNTHRSGMITLHGEGGSLVGGYSKSANIHDEASDYHGHMRELIPNRGKKRDIRIGPKHVNGAGVN